MNGLATPAGLKRTGERIMRRIVLQRVRPAVE